MPRSSSSSSSINTMLTSEISWLHPNPTDLRSRAKKRTSFDHKTSDLKEIYCRELSLKNSSCSIHPLQSLWPQMAITRKTKHHPSLHLGVKFRFLHPKGNLIGFFLKRDDARAAMLDSEGQVFHFSGVNSMKSRFLGSLGTPKRHPTHPPHTT